MVPSLYKMKEHQRTYNLCCSPFYIWSFYGCSLGIGVTEFLEEHTSLLFYFVFFIKLTRRKEVYRKECVAIIILFKVLQQPYNTSL